MPTISKIKAAVLILKAKKRPMRVEDIIKISLDKKMITTKGKTPDTTLNADIINENRRKKKKGLKPRFKKMGPKLWKFDYDN